MPNVAGRDRAGAAPLRLCRNETEKRMSETKDSTDKTSSGTGRKPLSLQRTVESGLVRQNFSHGRSKSVVVEKRRTRKLSKPGDKAATEKAKTAESETKPTPRVAKSKPATPAKPAAGGAPTGGQQYGGMSESELAARNRALSQARAQEATPAEKPEPPVAKTTHEAP